MKVTLHPRERAPRVIRLMGWLGLLMAVGILAAVALPVVHDNKPLPLAFYPLFAFLLGMPLSLFFVAKGIFAKRNWARWVGMAYAVISLFGIPIGTIIGGYVLWQLQKGWPPMEA